MYHHGSHWICGGSCLTISQRKTSSATGRSSRTSIMPMEITYSSTAVSVLQKGQGEILCAVLSSWINICGPEAYAQGTFKFKCGVPLLPWHVGTVCSTSKHFPGKNWRVHVSEYLQRKYDKVYHGQAWAPIIDVLQVYGMSKHYLQLYYNPCWYWCC